MLYYRIGAGQIVDNRCLMLEERAQTIGGRVQLEGLVFWTHQKLSSFDYKCENAAKLLYEKASHLLSGACYRYTPLPPGAPYFRYLLLEPAEDTEAELICSLHVASLNDAPDFEAIS